MLQWFYIYLFSVSVLFLLYAYTCLLSSGAAAEQQLPVSRTSAKPPPPQQPPQADTHDPLITKSASRIRLAVESRSHTGSFFLRLGAVGEWWRAASLDKPALTLMTRRQRCDVTRARPRTVAVSSVLIQLSAAASAADVAGC